MSVFKRKDGKSPYYLFEFRFRGQRFQGSTRFVNKTAALRYEANLIQKLACQRAGIPLEPEPLPFFLFFAVKFLEMVKNALRASTLRGYHSSLRILEPFHKLRLDEISAALVEKFKSERADAGKSPSTINRDLALLRLVLQAAVRQDLIQTHPFLARKVKLLKERKRQRVLSFAEERRYLSVASEVLHDVAVLMLELAMRPGEVFAIRLENVRLRSNHVHIPTGKTEESERDVPITERARQILESRIEAAKGPCLFPKRVGNGYDWSKPMTSLKGRHRDALKASGVRPPFRLYDLRHTGATRAAEGGASALDLQKLLGHTSLATTARYIHLSKRHLAGLQEKIERHRAEREISEAGEPGTVQ